MRVAMEYETKMGRAVTDVHEQNLGYDVTSLDTESGELRLIEVKGIGGERGPSASPRTKSGLPRTGASVTGSTS